MKKVLCSTGAIVSRKNGRDYRLIQKYAPLLHCDGFEFMMYDSWYDDYRRIARELSEASVNFSAFHVEKRVGELISINESGSIKRAEELFAVNCEAACIIGAEKLVLHLWDGLPSDKNISVNINEYEVLKNIAEKFGLLLTVENVPCNNRDPLTHFSVLREKYPDIAFTLDVRHAQFHGQLESICAGKYDPLLKDSIRHIHISDYSGGYMEWEKLNGLPVGEGHIDFVEFFIYMGKNGYAGDITLESPAVNPDGSVDTEKANKGIGYIRELCLSFL